MDIDNKYGTLDIQKKLMALMKVFHKFCVENDIKYSLDWGTLLGAIRHKGFIPWDDDLDVMMDRNNYNKLLRLIKTEEKLVFDNKNILTYWIGRVRLANDNGEDIYPPTIDILIMDNAPDNRFTRKIRIILILMIQGMLKVYPNFKKGSYLLRLCTFITYYIGKLFSRDFKLKMYDRLSQKSNRKNTQQITSYYEEFSCLGKYYPKNLMDEMILVPFEDMDAYVVKDYHQCLVTQFGPNYMTPIKTRPNHTEIYKQRLNDNS